MLTSLAAAWAKALVVTDVVEDGNWCVVEIALGLWGLVGGVEVTRCSSQSKGLENLGTRNPEGCLPLRGQSGPKSHWS